MSSLPLSVPSIHFTFQIEERKKQLKKEGKDSRVDEDDPEKLKRAVYVQTMKLFADMERKRRQQEVRDQEERKRKRDQEIAEEEQKKAEKEWQKNFEVLVCREKLSYNQS